MIWELILFGKKVGSKVAQNGHWAVLCVAVIVSQLFPVSCWCLATLKNPKLLALFALLL